jgi:hypothetical protein
MIFELLYLEFGMNRVAYGEKLDVSVDWIAADGLGVVVLDGMFGVGQPDSVGR